MRQAVGDEHGAHENRQAGFQHVRRSGDAAGEAEGDAREDAAASQDAADHIVLVHGHSGATIEKEEEAADGVQQRRCENEWRRQRKQPFGGLEALGARIDGEVGPEIPPVNRVAGAQCFENPDPGRAERRIEPQTLGEVLQGFGVFAGLQVGIAGVVVRMGVLRILLQQCEHAPPVLAAPVLFVDQERSPADVGCEGIRQNESERSGSFSTTACMDAAWKRTSGRVRTCPTDSPLAKATARSHPVGLSSISQSWEVPASAAKKKIARAPYSKQLPFILISHNTWNHQTTTDSIGNMSIRTLSIAFLLSALAGLQPAAIRAQDDEGEKKEEKEAEAPKEEPIFPDKNLETAVRQQVFAKRQNEEPIVASDVKNISTINGKGLGIKSLAGIEHCRALASLELADNLIKDISPIKDLKNIQLLDLANNDVDDISPVSGIIAIQYLEISHNNVTSIEPVKSLERLASLYASDNQITDISPVLELKKLSSLYLDNNQIASLEGIGKLDRVTSFGLRGNRITDLGPLKGARPMSFLFLENNQITDLAPLIEMFKADLEGEKRFAPFCQIYLRGNPLRSDSAKAQLREMKELNLRVKDMW